MSFYSSFLFLFPLHDCKCSYSVHADTHTTSKSFNPIRNTPETPAPHLSIFFPPRFCDPHHLGTHAGLGYNISSPRDSADDVRAGLVLRDAAQGRDSRSPLPGQAPGGYTSGEGG